MQPRLEKRDLTWLGKLVAKDWAADGTIPPIVLGRLLKYGLVQVNDKVISITPAGRAWLDADAT